MHVDNTDKNKQFYDNLYAQTDVAALVTRVRNLDSFIADAVITDTSWHGLYYGNLHTRLKGLRVLELGAGDGLNALVMAALGAHVVAVDISEVTPVIIQKAARELGLEDRIEGHAGDFLAMEYPAASFDLVVGKAFLHHLDHATEERFMRATARVLKPGGEARFFEPATNSPLLDALRYMIPVPGRPSSFDKAAFQKWKDADPHPDRDNSSAHYRETAGTQFKTVETVCIGGLERFHRIFPIPQWERPFRRLAFRLEKALPSGVNEFFARSQVIICAQPVPASNVR
jgi:SAM-dependent methyltransferase